MTNTPYHSEKDEVKITGNKSGKNETGYEKILVTAILTALLTSIVQFCLQKSQLSGEQEYWQKRYRIENVDKNNHLRLQLVEEINKGLLQLEIQAKEIKINAAASKYFNSVEEASKLTDLMVKYHKDLYLNAAKIQMASLYFGNNVDSLIPILGEALEKNFENNLLLKQDGAKWPEFELDFETIDTLTISRNKLIKAMIEEVNKTYDLKSE